MIDPFAPPPGSAAEAFTRLREECAALAEEIKAALLPVYEAYAEEYRELSRAARLAFWLAVGSFFSVWVGVSLAFSGNMRGLLMVAGGWLAFKLFAALFELSERGK